MPGEEGEAGGGSRVRAWTWSEAGVDGEGEGFVLPTGTVAFLLTDVAGSTSAWEAEADRMAEAMDLHNQLLDAVVSARGGVCPPAQGEGDSIVAAFSRASDAVLAAIDAQRALAAADWPTPSPLLVRMAIHAGEARFIDDGNYAGHAIIRTARLRAIAAGGQVLVSASAHDLTVDQLGDAVGFRDLGEHRLRDLARPERVWQLLGEGLPDEFEPLRSLDAHPHNLPVQLSSFVGRVEETRTLVRLLASERLVTITGAGGSGKTRLAQQVAAEILPTLDAGAWWVELADLTDPVQLPGAIARACAVKAETGPGAVDALVERLVGPRLLVLDNCEHLVDGVASLVDDLLRRCPALRVLATSREPLAVDGEVAWRIPPLAVPPVRSPSSPAPITTVGQFDAVRLFLDRAQRVRPNFHLDDDNAPDVAEICQRLDGIPLAIELAAARFRSLRPHQIRAGLADAFGLLTGGTRASLPRQQTLEASVAWSHDLLTEPEQVLFRRLSVFRGGCLLDDAEEVVADDALAQPDVLDLLDRLVAQSLVVADEAGSVQRYRVLETIRQYGHRRLADAGETEALGQRHTQHYVAKARRTGPGLEQTFDVERYRWFIEEMDNLDAAVRCHAEAGDLGEAVEVCGHLSLGWGFVDPPRCRALMTEVLDRVDDDLRRGRLLVARAQLGMWAGDLAASAMDAVTGLALADGCGDEATARRARLYVGQVMPWIDATQAAEQLEQTIAESREAGDLPAEALASIGLGGMRAGMLGDLVAARVDLERGAEVADRLGNPMIRSWVTAQLGLLAAFAGELDEAERLADEAERIHGRWAIPLTGRGSGGSVDGAISQGILTFVRAFVAANRGGPSPFLDDLPAMAARTAEAGYLLQPSLLELAHALSRADAGDLIGMRASLERAEAAHARAGAVGAAVNLAPFWADLALAEGDLDDARRRLVPVEEQLARTGSHHALVHSTSRRAAIALAEGDLEEAEQQAHRTLEAASAQGIAMGRFHGFELLAQAAIAVGSPAEGVRLAGIAGRFRADRGIGMRLAWHADHLDASLAEARRDLGDAGFDAAFAEGWGLDDDEALAYVRRARGERKRPSFGWAGLTPTEAKVVEHVTEGRTNPEIAAAMFISRETVKTHLSHVFAKLGVSSRAELAAAAARRDHPPG